MFSIAKSHPRPGVWRADVPALADPGFGEVAVEVIKAGICGTDFHIFKWDRWSAGRVPTPMTIGHEFVGRIAALGPGVEHLRIGQRVSAECHVTCGVCVQCRTGNGHLCTAVAIFGVDRPGCFAETVTVPAANLWPVPDAIPDHHGAVFDPVGNAMHTVTSVPVTGQDVLVVGAGPIGLFAAAIARAHGARRVIVQEPNPYRAGLADALGADLVVPPGADTAVLAATDGLGPSAVLEMSGNADALRAALRLARPGAHISLLGLFDQPLELDLSSVVMKGLVLHGVTGRRMFDTWYQVESFMQTRPDLVETVITHQLPADRFAEGFALIEAGQCAKVVLDFAQAAAPRVRELAA